MPDLIFSVDTAEPIAFAASPTLALKLRVTNRPDDELIHSIVLQIQIQIEATRRRYEPSNKLKLADLFGDPDRWSRTLRSMLWTNTNLVIPSFREQTATDLKIPCTFDFNVAATKYFHGVDDGEIPLNLLFSGTVFYSGTDGALQVAPIPWNKEARYRLPVAVWKTMMDDYYPNSTWLSIRRDVFERLYEFKIRNGIATWEEALERLIESSDREAVER